jgi:hypothetical protein
MLLQAQDSRAEIFTSPEKSGGVNYAYPFDAEAPTADAPTGFSPFYISHFGRHGSRYLVNDNEYKKVFDVFEKAKQKDNLTALGNDVHLRLKIIWDSVRGKGGSLSPLGRKQIEGIAQRMFQKYPTVFAGEAKINAVSTTVSRCIKSMNLFCNQLQQLNVQLNIEEDADERHMQYLNFHTKQAVNFRSSPDVWRNEYKRFEIEHVKPERILKSLFLEPEKVSENLNPVSFMFDLFDIAGNLQNTEVNISLYDIFEKEELFNLWQCKNYSLYVQYANAAINNGMMMENAKPLLEDMLNKVNDAISNESNGASIRFGHDGNIIPLAMLLHIENSYNSTANPSEFYKYWSDFKVAPMAANVQMIFYKNTSSKEILVKFLYNEKEVHIPPVSSDILPYYRWSDVKVFYHALLQKSSTQLSKNAE